MAKTLREAAKEGVTDPSVATDKWVHILEYDHRFGTDILAFDTDEALDAYVYYILMENLSELSTDSEAADTLRQDIIAQYDMYVPGEDAGDLWDLARRWETLQNESFNATKQQVYTMDWSNLGVGTAH